MLHTKLQYSPKSFTPVHEIVYPTNQLRRLLVVAEDESAVVAMEAHFSALGWQVDCAFELEEAEALLACRSYSAVVTDLRLAGQYGVSGLRIVSQVRARCPQTNIFVWTAVVRTPELDAETHQRGGIDGFFAKPQSLADMAHAIGAMSEQLHA